MVELRMASHSRGGHAIVEVWDYAGRFVAAIYPDDESNGIKIVSKYFDESDPVPIVRELGNPPVPSLTIPFPRGP